MMELSPATWALIVTMGVMVLAVIAIAATAGTHPRRRIDRHGVVLCSECGYPTTGLRSTHCPECGAVLPPRDVKPTQQATADPASASQRTA